MIKKIKSRLKKFMIKINLIKINVLETVTIDGMVYKIIDRTSILPIIKNTRLFSFKKDNIIYNYSSIFLNPKHHFQPSLFIPQEIISVWSKSYSFNRALVLGCAGCSVPRFIGLHYPKSKTVGIELSEDVIKVAKNHFLLDQIKEQFELVQGDAIFYVKNYNLDYKQDVVFVDVFCENKVIPEVFTESFITSAFNIVDEDGIIIINILGEDINSVKAFFDNTKLSFRNIFVVKQGNVQFVVLTKTTDTQKENDFINNLKAKKTLLFQTIFNK